MHWFSDAPRQILSEGPVTRSMVLGDDIWPPALDIECLVRLGRLCRGQGNPLWINVVLPATQDVAVRCRSG